MIHISPTGKVKIFNLFLLLFIVIILSCNNNKKQSDTKNTIIETETRFQQLLVSDGAATAFYAFAADSAVIKRQNDSLIFGKEAIKKFYSNPIYKNAIAIWKPDFIDLSDDGTLAYTFGKYEWTFPDSTGKKTTYKGIFHTVWKKASDGSWKYVWD